MIPKAKLQYRYCTRITWYLAGV